MQVAVDDNRAWVLTLVANCPRHAALPNCPADAIRKTPMWERVSIVEKMNDRELDDFVSHHQKCIAERDEKTRLTHRFAVCK